MRGILNTSPILSGVTGFLGILISLFPMAFMCLIWLNMHLFYWILVLIMYLSLQAVMTCTMLHFTVICWLGMSYKTCCTVVDYYLPMMRIQTLVLFLSWNALFKGMLFVDWEIYDMLWCSQYCVTIQMGVPLGGKLKFTSNISSLMKGWYERSYFNVGRVEVFVPIISSEPGDHPLPNLLLC